MALQFVLQAGVPLVTRFNQVINLVFLAAAVEILALARTEMQQLVPIAQLITLRFVLLVVALLVTLFNQVIALVFLAAVEILVLV